MLQQLIDNYESFGDALITELRYKSNFNYSDLNSIDIDEVEIYISCFNKNRNYERDLIKVVCRNIIHYNFRKHEGMIFQALLNTEKGVITLDFSPDLVANPKGEGVLSKEKMSSDCIIKCKEVEYSIVA